MGFFSISVWVSSIIQQYHREPHRPSPFSNWAAKTCMADAMFLSGSWASCFINDKIHQLLQTTTTWNKLFGEIHSLNLVIIVINKLFLMFLNAGCSFDSVCWPFFPCPISCYGPLIMSSKVSYGFIHGVKSIPLDTQVRKFTLIITLLCGRPIGRIVRLAQPVCLSVHPCVPRARNSKTKK